MKKINAILLISSLYSLICLDAQAATYTTTFPLTENPISEGGKWIGGQSAGGNLWGDVRTNGSLAFGVSEPTQFGDPTAILTGTWTADQSASAVVKINSSQSGTCCHEAEVRLRTTITANRITGYEVYCSVLPGDPYCHIASWGGPNGAWVNMDGNSPSIYLKNGDVLKGTVTGTNPTIITMYINGVQVLQVQDTGNYTFSDGRKYGPWTSGSPGIGFYDNQDTQWSGFGISSFTATDGSTGGPPTGPYQLPSDRAINWGGQAGLDPIGGIPNYTSVTCAGLDASGTSDMTSAIQTCINNAASNTAVFIPPGTYLINGTIRMKNNVVLRGAKAAVAPWLPTADASATTLKFNSGSSQINFDGGAKDLNWSPGAQSGTPITAGYTQGSNSITVNSATAYSVGDIISIYQNADPALISDKGDDWLGEDSGPDPHVMAQYSKITAKSGNTLTINPPLYLVSPAPTGQSLRKQTFGVAMAGLENLRIDGSGVTKYRPINIDFTRHSWIKGVECFECGGNDGAGSPHVWIEFSYGLEIRDNYFHGGASNDSGRNYGIEFYHWNSSHKVENNIVRDTRHSIIFEGGGSGNAILYNYTDDNWESVQGAGSTYDNGFLSEDEVSNHGAHPYMNLWEGNSTASIWGDYTQGSSSHNTFFRNYVRCKQTNLTMSSSPWDWVCIEIEQYNRYYNLIGNVVGLPTLSNGTVLVNSSAGYTKPAMYRFGFSSNGGTYTDTLSYSTVIRQGNYNSISHAVDNWDDSNHTLPSSLYYGAKPGFFGSVPWPPIGSDVGALTNKLPAQLRYEGSGSPSTNACDINNDSATNVSDVQLCVNQAIGTVNCGTGDINKDAACNVIDVQRVVNAALGGACVTQ